WCSAQRVFFVWSQDDEGDKRDTWEKAQAAANMAPEDTLVLTVLATALVITRELRAGQMMIEKAVALDPNSAWAWNRSGWIRNYLDDPDTAIAHFEKAIRLSPFDPMTFLSYGGIGAAHFIARRYAPAVIWVEKALLAHPNFVSFNRVLAPVYVFAGNQQGAEASIRRLVTAYPDMTVSAIRANHVFSDEVKD